MFGLVYKGRRNHQTVGSLTITACEWKGDWKALSPLSLYWLLNGHPVTMCFSFIWNEIHCDSISMSVCDTYPLCTSHKWLKLLQMEALLSENSKKCDLNRFVILSTPPRLRSYTAERNLLRAFPLCATPWWRRLTWLTLTKNKNNVAISDTVCVDNTCPLSVSVNLFIVFRHRHMSRLFPLQNILRLWITKRIKL